MIKKDEKIKIGNLPSKTAYKRSLSLNSDQKKELSSLIGDNNDDKIKLDNSSSKLGYKRSLSSSM